VASFSGSVLVVQMASGHEASEEIPRALRKNFLVPDEDCGIAGVTTVEPIVVPPVV